MVTRDIEEAASESFAHRMDSDSLLKIAGDESKLLLFREAALYELSDRGDYSILAVCDKLLASGNIENQVQDGMDHLILHLGGLEDTNLTISHVEDDSLLYSFDIDLYDPASSTYAYTVNTEPFFHYFEAHVRINSMNVTLGTGVTYSLGIWGSDLSSSVSYDNGALVGGYLDYNANGSLLIEFTEDVIMNDDLEVLGPGSNPATPLGALFLDIDLPSGVGCSLDLGAPSNLVPISFVERVGWTWDGFEAYETAPGNPNLDIVVGYCDQVYANLLD